MRIFVAIGLPPSIQRGLSRAQAFFRQGLSSGFRAESGLRWTQPDGIHLTLKFLGEVSEAEVQRAITHLRSIEPFPAFHLEVKGFGFFPDARRPRVFWAGVVAPSALEELATCVDQALSPLGFATENRDFSPHLTLARFKAPGRCPSLEALVNARQDETIGGFDVSEFYLFESRLSAGVPATYIALAHFPQTQRE
jgi:RNA 2',3'-cyclic 3'-phosphodiesterase